MFDAMITVLAKMDRIETFLAIDVEGGVYMIQPNYNNKSYQVHKLEARSRTGEKLCNQPPVK